MNDTITPTTEQFINALLHLIEVKKEHDYEHEKCREDWDYFGSREIEQLNSAKFELQQAMRAWHNAQQPSNAP